jgi:hypothetical protein
MSNLLPRSSKRNVITEYRVRLLASWLLMLAAVFFVCAWMLLPSYIVVSSELATAEGAFQKQTKDTSATYASTVKEIREANSIGARLAKSNDDVRVTDVLKDVTAELGSNVQFVGFSFTRQGTGLPLVELRGMAHTRDDLAKFIERLKANASIADATVPFSEFAQATNAAFTATIKLRDTHKKAP